MKKDLIHRMQLGPVQLTEVNDYRPLTHSGMIYRGFTLHQNQST